MEISSWQQQKNAYATMSLSVSLAVVNSDEHMNYYLTDDSLVF